MKTLAITLSEQQVNIILSALSELPIKVAAGTYNHVFETASAAFAPAEASVSRQGGEAPEKDDDAGDGRSSSAGE